MEVKENWMNDIGSLEDIYVKGINTCVHLNKTMYNERRVAWLLEPKTSLKKVN